MPVVAHSSRSDVHLVYPSVVRAYFIFRVSLRRSGRCEGTTGAALAEVALSFFRAVWKMLGLVKPHALADSTGFIDSLVDTDH